MAKKQPKQSASSRKAANNPNTRQPRSGNAAPQKRKAAPAPKQTSQPKPAKREPKEAPTAGSILWRLALILCAGLVIFSLLFASINGGSKIVGVTPNDTKTENAAPTPPVDIDPNINITGSDATPIPPSPTPGVDPTPAPNGGENSGGMIINGQPVTQ